MHMGSNERGAYYDKTGKGQRYLSDAVVDAQKNWPTPQTSDQNGAASSDRPAHRKQLRDVEHGLGLHAPANPSTDGSRPESWLTRRANEPEGDPNFVARNADRGEYCHGSLGSQVKSWATPIMGDSHLASTPDVAQKRIEEGKVTLSRQNPGKLNPRWVETLMGLPIGWTMPSCTRPVTIEPTNCDCLGTELSQPPQNELLELF
jgi:hypothetical protein